MASMEGNNLQKGLNQSRYSTQSEGFQNNHNKTQRNQDRSKKQHTQDRSLHDGCKAELDAFRTQNGELWVQYNAIREENARLKQEQAQLERHIRDTLQDLDRVSQEYHHVVNTCLEPFAKSIDTSYLDTSRANKDSVLQNLLEAAQMAPDLQHQLGRLKDEMSSRAHMEAVIPDSGLEQDFRALAIETRPFSRMSVNLEIHHSYGEETTESSSLYVSANLSNASRLPWC
ncbi:hypothetical protein NX059_007728 [Plenodomus lindquistii]|nr:hypothetical protein NX059_007728 [Plenodomus lindquistii]